MRLLIYSQDGLGLGHFKRTTNIAEAVLARSPESVVLTMADSAATYLVSPIRGMDYEKLPTIVKRGRSSSSPASWEPATLPMDIKDVLRMREVQMLEICRTFEPTAILVDHMPVGALGELKPLLDHAVGMKNRPRLLLGIRDILDAPDVIRPAWDESGAYEYLSHYDGVLIYGCRDIYDAEDMYDLGAHAKKVSYCNYVVSPGNGRVRRPLDSDDPPVVLVMGGGGADVFPIADAFLDALPSVRTETDMTAVILTGPNMSPADRQKLTERAKGYPVNVHIQTSSSDVGSILDTADVVVTMAGYNSLCEIMERHKKALVVPRSGPSFEQRMRGELLCKRGLIRMLDPDDLNGQRLGEELLRLLLENSVPDTSMIPPLDGAEHAADHLLAEIGQPLSPQPSNHGAVGRRSSVGSRIKRNGKGSVQANGKAGVQPDLSRRAQRNSKRGSAR